MNQKYEVLHSRSPSQGISRSFEEAQGLRWLLLCFTQAPCELNLLCFATNNLEQSH